jgi:uncharacterized protein YfaS (alpha-2-macroglobulin family)
MKSMRVWATGLVALIGTWFMTSRAEQPTPDRDKARKLFQDGNYKEAYDGLRALVLDPKADPRLVPEDLSLAVQALQALSRVDEADDLREKAVAAHPDGWRLLRAVADSYLTTERFGSLVAGKFVRGPHRGQSEVVSSTERDRARALQLYTQGLPKAIADDDKPGAGSFLLGFASALMDSRYGADAWRLQELTDLKALPDYEPGYRGWGWGRGGDNPGAPVDAEGNPVYHKLPESFEAAKSDGERWRRALMMAGEVNGSLRLSVKKMFADFLQGQFGVETIAGGPFHPAAEEDDALEATSGPFAVRSLKDDETIARLASGIKRFALPDEFNPIKIYREIADAGKSTEGEQSLGSLAGVYTNRRQHPRAAEILRRNIEQYGDDQNKSKQLQLDQIVGGWGRFEPSGPQEKGKGATVDYRFRNGKKVGFTAQRLDVAQLLSDVKDYLRTKPRELDWSKFNLDDLGYALVTRKDKSYAREQVAAWEMDLKPAAEHQDAQVRVATPLQEPGAYLVTARMEGGNVARAIIWVADMAIVRKPVDGAMLYYIADATSGKPVAGADLDFIGFGQVYEDLGNNRGRNRTEFGNFAEKTDANGMAKTDPKLADNRIQWATVARTSAGRLAFIGFRGIWTGNRADARMDQVKAYLMTDRPVYRPEQSVQYKLWVRRAKYDLDDANEFGGRDFKLVISNPKGERISEGTVRSDESGGIAGTFPLGSDAALGAYHIMVEDIPGGGSFRVEEYKKPEFEVTVDAPKEPVALGEAFEATIKAKYYFGAPVTQAKVKYKVTRTAKEDRWFPIGRWDWLYGSGYWWFGSDYTWYPGWGRWGCMRPYFPWLPRRSDPPEVVAEAEVPVGADGTVKVRIDSAPAKAVHPDDDHVYQISAEVTDQSRRTIDGAGSVTAAKKPFAVTLWADRGYYQAGDAIRIHAAARTPDGKPVKGAGKLRLFQIRYDEQGTPKETEVQSWDLATDEEGKASQQAKADEPGQYRWSYTVTDAKERSIEGGYILLVRGAAGEEGNYRFNDLEVIPDKKEYAPGEKVRLLVNTRRAGSSVLLFVRCTNGVYPMPKLITLDGKSHLEEIALTPGDMPNIVVEAVTVGGAGVFTETREIIVPPAERVLNVAVEPSAAEYRPGEKAKVKVRVTDEDGKPAQASAVMTIYDKSVDYIAGGSNVPAIREYFWKWRRNHYPRTESNLDWRLGSIYRENEIPMQDLGVFGNVVAGERVQSFAISEQTRVPARGARAYFGRARAEGMMMGGMGANEGAPMPAAALSVVSADKMELAGDRAGAEAGEAPAMAETTVRTQFADTALWKTDLATDANGEAEVELTMPENLTGWKVRTWSLGAGTRVGEGTAEVVTSKNVLVRLQAPRFFVETDEVVLSANIRNGLKTDKQVQALLELGSSSLAALDDGQRTLTIKAGEEARVDWRVKVAHEGEAIVRMKALTDEESDAMEMRFPVYVHGMLRTESFSGAVRRDQSEGSITFKVPEKRRINDARVEVRFSPSLAGAMVDALPYLADYPYGCTEQTLNRFVPTVLTQNILKRMNLNLEAIREKRTNLNAQELGDPADRSKQWKRFEHNPVFDAKEVERMAKVGISDLSQMQLSDGGWGWFSGYGEHSSAHTTATVVHGLQVAGTSGLGVPPDVLTRGVDWLKAYQAKELVKLLNAPTKKEPYKTQADATDALVYSVLADADFAEPQMRDFLYRDRTKIGTYGLALLGLALQKQGQQEQLGMVMRNLSQYLVRDDENQSAHLRLPQGYAWWYWHGDEIETQAAYLKLLARTEPKGEVAPRLVKYLLNNRKHATYWNSTRDTAYCIEALAEYMTLSGEDRPDLTVEVLVDGEKKKEVRITPDSLFTFDNALTILGDAVTTGEHTVTLRKQGTGPLYFNAYVTNFTLEDRIAAAGLEVKVGRKFYKLDRKEAKATVAGGRGQAIEQDVEKYERTVIVDGAMLKSGDLVEVELEIDSKNDYEYLIFEDFKAAGFEPVEVRSGYNGNAMGAYVEFRDEKVCFFVRQLARGKSSVSYRLRAEIPGRFSALPTVAQAMYAPELRGNSDEMKVGIED